MKACSRKDFWSGVFFVAAGVAFAAGAVLNYQVGDSAQPGPGYFPLGLGVVLAILGATVIVRSCGRLPDFSGEIGAFAWRPLLVVLGAVTVFGLALPSLGLLIALPLLIVIGSFASGEFRWKEAVVNAVVVTALNFGLFVIALGLPLPY